MNFLESVLEAPALSGVASFITIGAFVWSLIMTVRRRREFKKTSTSAAEHVQRNAFSATTPVLEDSRQHWSWFFLYAITGGTFILILALEIFIFKDLVWGRPFDLDMPKTRMWLFLAPGVICMPLALAMIVMNILYHFYWIEFSDEEFDRLYEILLAPFGLSLLPMLLFLIYNVLRDFGWL